jgi:hypothetical protein
MRNHRVLALSLVAGVSVACSSTSAPDKSAPHTTGVFTLVSANGEALPAAVFEGTIVTDEIPPYHLRVLATSGSITIDANGHYEHRVNHDAMIDGVLGGRPNHTDRGSCTRSGEELHCVSEYLQAVEFTASLSGDVITIAQDLVREGHVATYRYQWTSSL